MNPINHWLLKSEPSSFGVDDLAKRPKRTAAWDGVRNYQVRNMLRNAMKKGDLAFFYHSSCEVPGIAGIVELVSSGHPDATALDRNDDHFDPKSTAENPIWYAVDVKLVRKLRRVITLDELRAHAKSSLRNLSLLRRGNRLSITPVTKDDWNFIIALE
jgi:predicted RNA-binding protein with PUA-like domain